MITKKFNGYTLTFNPEKHKYYIGEQELVSVTTFVHTFFPDFDAPAMALKLSLNPKKKEYFGKDPQEIVKLWEEKGKISRELGTEVHDNIDCYIKGYGKNLPKDEKTKNLFYEARKFIASEEFYNKYEIIASEKTVCLPNYGLSGTIDIILREKATGEYVIGDWKTNEEIKDKNFFSKGISPIAHLDDCNLNHYSLQLGIYGFILEEAGVYPCFEFKKILFHLTEEKVNVIECLPMDTEIKMLLENRRKNLDLFRKI